MSISTKIVLIDMSKSTNIVLIDMSIGTYIVPFDMSKGAKLVSITHMNLGKTKQSQHRIVLLAYLVSVARYYNI